MTATEDKFNALLTKMDAKMDALLRAKADQEVKLNSILQKLENLKVSQKKTANDVKDLKKSYGYLNKSLKSKATLQRKHPTWSWPNLRKK